MVRDYEKLLKIQSGGCYNEHEHFAVIAGERKMIWCGAVNKNIGIPI